MSDFWCPGPGVVLDEADSTNSWLKEQKLPVGSWVMARRQRAGRGRGHKTWISPPGNLYLSVVLPRLNPLPLASLGLGVAVCYFCRAQGVPAQLKWPNDLCLGPAKLGGLLCETTDEGIVAGLGLNLREGNLPKGAVSLQDWCHDAEPCAWANSLVACLPVWTSPSIDSVRVQAHWLELHHGQEREFDWGKGRQKARLVDLDLQKNTAIIITNGKKLPVVATSLHEYWPFMVADFYYEGVYGQHI